MFWLEYRAQYHDEEVVQLAVRVPRTVKRALQHFAVDYQVSLSDVVAEALYEKLIEWEGLARRMPDNNERNADG